MRRHLTIASVLGLLLALLPASSALASCAPAPPLEESFAAAEVVFKGTVTSTEDGTYTAIVTVDEVWKGPPLSGTVTVHGGQVDDDPNDGESVVTSVDRTFEAGLTYLFFPLNDSDPFFDNICSPTQLYESSLEELRLPSTSGPAVETDGSEPAVKPGADLPMTGVSFLGLLIFSWTVMGAGIGLLAYRKHRALPRY